MLAMSVFFAIKDAIASLSNYKKIPRELTLMLQEALLRDAVKFEFDNIANLPS